MSVLEEHIFHEMKQEVEKKCDIYDPNYIANRTRYHTKKVAEWLVKQYLKDNPL